MVNSHWCRGAVLLVGGTVGGVDGGVETVDDEEDGVAGGLGAVWGAEGIRISSTRLRSTHPTTTVATRDVHISIKAIFLAVFMLFASFLSPIITHIFADFKCTGEIPVMEAKECGKT